MKHSVLRILLIATLVSQSGCKPSEEENKKARAEVSASTATPELMDAQKINAIIAAANKGSTTDYDGKLFRFAGAVKKISFEETKTEADTNRTVHLVVHNADYQAVDISCYFAAADESNIRELTPGALVNVRGKFRSAGTSAIELEGCILDK